MAFLPSIIALVLILARAIAELWLSRLNQRHVRAHANQVPLAFREMIDNTTYRRSVDYTLAKSRFGEVVTWFDVVRPFIDLEPSQQIRSTRSYLAADLAVDECMSRQEPLSLAA